jgi:isopentenyl-diphosphate delta-isomerase
MEERVILVDEQDRNVGSEAKLTAHQAGKLHRAFSIFVLDPRGRVLLQRRAASKYHSRLRWSNTCCGHPRPGEATGEAARRRLQEEMGFACALEEVYRFTYRTEVEGGLTEHEVDHVFVGQFDGVPIPNPEEVDSWCWADVEDLRTDLKKNPARYSAWLTSALEGLRERGRV